MADRTRPEAGHRAERDPGAMECDNARQEAVMAEKRKTDIDAGLLEELRRRAEEQGRSEGELLDEAVRSYLKRSRSLAELLERMERGRRERGVEPLSEEEAMRLAVEEQHAWRRERRERAG